MEKVTSLSVMEGEPLIKKVEMEQGGRKGLKVTYSTYESRNGMSSVIDIVRKQKRPVQRELREWFKELRLDLLRICGYELDTQNKVLLHENSVEVTGVIFTEDKFFQIIGTKKVMGDYLMDLATPKIDIEEYSLKDNVQNAINNIHRETSLFMRGLKGADKKQITLDYMSIKKGIENPEEAWNNLSKLELMEIMDEALDKSGLEFVFEDGEWVATTVSEEDVQQTKMSFKEQYEKTNEIDKMAIESILKTQEKKEAKKAKEEAKLAEVKEEPKEDNDMLFLDETPQFDV